MWQGLRPELCKETPPSHDVEISHRGRHPCELLRERGGCARPDAPPRKCKLNSQCDAAIPCPLLGPCTPETETDRTQCSGGGGARNGPPAERLMLPFLTELTVSLGAQHFVPRCAPRENEHAPTEGPAEDGHARGLRERQRRETPQVRVQLCYVYRTDATEDKRNTGLMSSG